MSSLVPSRARMVIPASLTTDAVLAIGQQILRTMPTVFKYIVYLLLALNIKSFPLVWHCESILPRGCFPDAVLTGDIFAHR